MTRLSINVPDRLKEKLKRLQDFWAHQNTSMDYIELIEKSVDIALTQVDPTQKKVRVNKSKAVPDRNSDVVTVASESISKVADAGSTIPSSVDLLETSPQRLTGPVAQSGVKQAKVDIQSRKSNPIHKSNKVEPKPNIIKRPTYFSMLLNKELWERAGSQCEFRDHLTDHRCTSRFGLERDHIIPIAKGGSHDISNLRLMCKTHNLLMARREFGSAKIDCEIKKSRDSLT